MTYTDTRIPIRSESVHIERFHLNLGDLINGQYDQTDGNASIEIVIHYSDDFGRDKHKTVSLPGFLITQKY